MKDVQSEFCTLKPVRYINHENLIGLHAKDRIKQYFIVTKGDYAIASTQGFYNGNNMKVSCQ